MLVVGAPVGDTVGEAVGDDVGAAVGATVVAVGDTVGEAVGVAVVGVAVVGAAVGAAVGAVANNACIQFNPTCSKHPYRPPCARTSLPVTLVALQQATLCEELTPGDTPGSGSSGLCSRGPHEALPPLARSPANWRPKQFAIWWSLTWHTTASV